MTFSRFALLCSLCLTSFSFSACEVPLDAPTGPLQPNQPSATPSERPDSGDPLCFQTLQCIVDNTSDNVLRRQAQEVVNQLFLVAEPDYTRICESRSVELVVSIPSCQR